MYQIETLYQTGIWSDELGTGDNEFATEAEAYAMIEELRKIDEDWASAEYRVVAIENAA